MSSENHKCGFVAIIGKPNVGKSTLLNTLLGMKLSIVTPKAQTTRQRILGILNGEGYQILFLDTPGYIDPLYLFHKAMLKQVEKAMKDADVLLYLISPEEKYDESRLIEVINQSGKPVILTLNKKDIATEEQIRTRLHLIGTQLLHKVEEIAISALNGEGVGELIQLIVKHLPESPPYYPPDQISDKPERFFAAEIIREKLFLYLQKEVPYHCYVDIMEFREEDQSIRIEAYIYVSKESHIPIVIGKGGKMLSMIKRSSEEELSLFFGKKIFLNLRVKLAENWHKSKARLKWLGYNT
jgi:GTP-binding protein Era